MSSKEYLKKYIAKDKVKWLKYKSDWQFRKRHGGLTREEVAMKIQPTEILKEPEIISWKARNQCCLCLKRIDKVFYPKYGNYCVKCTMTCNYLATLTFRKKTSPKYEEECEKFIKSLPLVVSM